MRGFSDPGVFTAGVRIGKIAGIAKIENPPGRKRFTVEYAESAERFWGLVLGTWYLALSSRVIVMRLPQRLKPESL
jgi:hypothetical protein